MKVITFSASALMLTASIYVLGIVLGLSLNLPVVGFNLFAFEVFPIFIVAGILIFIGSFFVDCDSTGS
jgi:hypothetical protein